MKRSALIELYSPGIVLFDPVQLATFIKSKGVTDTNIFDAFLKDEMLGRQAIELGAACPIYQISEQEYSVFTECQNVDSGYLPEPIFVYSGLPLVINSGVLIVSDLNALFDWDEGFFLDYKSAYESRLPSNDYIDVEPGIYSLSIKGYVGLSDHGSKWGYGLEFISVPALPVVGDGFDVNYLDFELVAR